jgi:hypothetical protein
MQIARSGGLYIRMRKPDISETREEPLFSGLASLSTTCTVLQTPLSFFQFGGTHNGCFV